MQHFVPHIFENSKVHYEAAVFYLMFVASVLPREEWRMVGSVCDCRIGLR